MMTQKQMILNDLSNGKVITPLGAMQDYRCMRLAAVVYDLKKDGHNIITKTVKGRNGKSYASYRLIPRV